MLFCFHFLCVLFSPLAVNGDLSNNKKSSLLVEDFIKVDVLLVKICHKRRKVCSWLAQVLVIVKNYSSLSTVGRQITDKLSIAIISAACDISNNEACRIALQCFANLFGAKTYRQITNCQPSDNRLLVGQQAFSGIFLHGSPSFRDRWKSN